MAQAPKRSSPAAKPSDRYYQDLRQLARLARSESVVIDRRRDGGITITPFYSLNDSTNKAGNRQRGQETARKKTLDAAVPQPIDTVDCEPEKTVSKKQQRDARRLQEFQEAKRAPQPKSTARWLLLAQRQLWAARKATCNAVWTAWARSRTPEARLATRRKLRGLLWRAWTRPCIEPPVLASPYGSRTHGLQVLGPRSMRDEYILKRARALCSRHGGRADGMSKALWAWMGHRRKLDFDHSMGWNSPLAGTRSPETAGLITPASARNRKKKTRGGSKA